MGPKLGTEMSMFVTTNFMPLFYLIIDVINKFMFSISAGFNNYFCIHKFNIAVQYSETNTLLISTNSIIPILNTGTVYA